MHDSQSGISLKRSKFCLTPDPKNLRRKIGRINTVTPETLTRIGPKETDNSTGVDSKQIETSKKQLKIIAEDTNHSPNENFSSYIREETTPEAEQEKSSESCGLEEIQDSGLVGEYG